MLRTAFERIYKDKTPKHSKNTLKDLKNIRGWNLGMRQDVINYIVQKYPVAHIKHMMSESLSLRLFLCSLPAELSSDAPTSLSTGNKKSVWNSGNTHSDSISIQLL